MTMRQKKNISLPTATLEWKVGDDAAVPLASQYEDTYYSVDDGLNETRHVFLKGNNLERRFTYTKSITIAETGFGTGLNCYATLQMWHANKKPHSHLQYISCERHPLTAETIRLAMKAWPELEPYVETVLAQYPSSEREFCQGYWTIQLHEINATVTLLFGEAAAMFQSTSTKVDAWFLDGFAPAKNSSMWNDEVFAEIARLSKPSTTIATFTAARAVRDLLSRHGFAISRIKGFGRKRHMTIGEFSGAQQNGVSHYPATRPTSTAPTDAIVIGGGIAACTTAERLAKKGVKVKLIHPETTLGDGASGVPLATIRPYFDANHSAASQFYLQSYLATLQQTSRIATSLDIEQHEFTDAQWINTLFGRFELHTELTEQSSETSLRYPRAASINLRSWCTALLAGCSAGLISEVPNTTIEKIQKTSFGWAVCSNNSIWHGSNVVVCTGNHLPSITHDTFSAQQMRAFRGQVSGFEATTQKAQASSGSGHIIQTDKTTWFGASYIPEDLSTDIRRSEFDKYRDKVATLETGTTIPSFEQCRHFAGIRGTTRDHLPVVGPAPNLEVINHAYNGWHRYRHSAKSLPNANLNGLYLNLAHGSKGATSALLSADIVASYITAQGFPTSDKIIQALHPARFALRDAKKKT